MPRTPSVAGPVHWMLVVAVAFVAAWVAPEASAQVRPPKPRNTAKKEPTPKEFKPKRGVERVIEVDVIDFDPYWRDGCLLLADSLQPLADITKNPGGDTSVDGEKRRAAAAPIAKEVETLRRNANTARKIRVLWLPISEDECRPVFVPAEIGLDVDAGESYDIATAKVLGGAGFATRLRPKPDPSVATEADVRAAAERIRGIFAPVDIEACTTITRIKKDTNSGARQANRERFDRALALPPEWNEGPDAIRSLKATAEVTDAPAAGLREGSEPAREVTVRVEAPKYVNAVTRVGFDLYEKTKDGTRGAKVNAKEPLVAWGYAGRPALCHVPVKTPCAFGYDVEIVAAKYR